jgi:hypothetical protein
MSFTTEFTVERDPRRVGGGGRHADVRCPPVGQAPEHASLRNPIVDGGPSDDQ